MNVRNVSCFLLGGPENLTFIRSLSAADVYCVHPVVISLNQNIEY